MATVAITTKQDFVDGEFVTWTLLTTTNADSAPTAFVGAGDRTVQVTGTFGVGGTAIVEGSLDSTNWFQLRDPSSTLISFTAAGVKAVLEACPFVRIRVTAGDGTTSITAMLYHRRNNNA